MNINEILIALLTSQLSGKALDETVREEITSDVAQELYDLSKHHDVAHITAAALAEARLLPKGELGSLFTNERMVAVFRYRRLADELRQLTELFESEGIDHIALKGSYLRAFYPEPWMRTSCDIDILVKTEDFEKATSLLTDAMAYKLCSRTSHDVSFDSPTGVHLELHFTLVEEETFCSSEELIMKPWEFARLADGKRFAYVLCDEFFYLYHIIHTAKHFLAGGCGIKSVLDHWVLNERVPHDEEKRKAILQGSEFAVFEQKLSELARAWFGGNEKDELALSFEAFIFSGGVYGTVQNGVSVGVVGKKSRLGYAISRIFPSFHTMCLIYPSLKKRKLFLPFYHIRRWCRIVFTGGMKRAGAEFSKNKNISEEEISNTERLLLGLGLKKS